MHCGQIRRRATCSGVDAAGTTCIIVSYPTTKETGMKDDLYPMISVEEAQQRILELLPPSRSEEVPLARGRRTACWPRMWCRRCHRAAARQHGHGWLCRHRCRHGGRRRADQPRQLRVIFDLAAGYTTYIHVLPGHRYPHHDRRAHAGRRGRRRAFRGDRREQPARGPDAHDYQRLQGRPG